MVEIQQGYAKNQVGTSLVANDLLWVMPVADNKFIKLVNEGDSQVYQVTDAGTNKDMTYEMELQQKLGIAVLFGMAFGMYKITL